MERRLGECEQLTGKQLDELGDRVAAAGRQAQEAQERVARAPHDPAGHGEAPTAVAAPRRVKMRPERLHQLVTAEPAPDNAPVYREALPLVVEWRRCLAARQEVPHTYAWLKREVRLPELEIRLIDEHQLTLPPAEYPWDGIHRHTEVRLRIRVLERIGRQLRWTRPLHWKARLITLGCGLRAPSLEHQLRDELQERPRGLLSEPDRDGQEAGSEGGEATPAEAAPRYIPHRIYREVVTVDEHHDDGQVYGDTMPVVTEWRCQQVQFNDHWPKLEGVEAEVRMLELEVELIEERELTLPPGELPRAWDQRRRALRRRSQRLGTARSNAGRGR